MRRAATAHPTQNQQDTGYVVGPSGEQLTEIGVNGSNTVWLHTNVSAGGKLNANPRQQSIVI